MAGLQNRHFGRTAKVSQKTGLVYKNYTLVGQHNEYTILRCIRSYSFFKTTAIVKTDPDVMSVIDSLDEDMATFKQLPLMTSLSDDISVRHDDVICVEN